MIFIRAQGKENEAAHMEESRRQETISNRLHSCEATLQEYIPGADIDLDHNLLVAEVQKKLKAIKKAGKWKPKWNLERIKSNENHLVEVME